MDNRRKENREKLTTFTPVYFFTPQDPAWISCRLDPAQRHGAWQKIVAINKQGTHAIEFPETLDDIRPVSLSRREWRIADRTWRAQITLPSGLSSRNCPQNNPK